MADTPTIYYICAQTARLLREALKEAFPTMKFSVRSRTYAGGASIDVYWTDGPASKQVQPICNRFEGADFDGMTDLKTCKTQMVNGKPIPYGADFIFAKRILSAAFLMKIAQAYYQQFDREMTCIIDHRTGASIAHSVKATPCLGKPLANGWCAEHEPAQTLLDLGARLAYPRLQVTKHRAIASGRGGWQACACRAPATWREQDLPFILQTLLASEDERHAALQSVEIPHGSGSLTGNRQEQQLPSFMAEGMKEQVRYKLGVMILNDGVERFYWPCDLVDVQREEI